MFVYLEFIVFDLFLGPWKKPKCSNFEFAIVQEGNSKIIALFSLLNFIHFYIWVWFASKSLSKHKLECLYVKLIDQICTLALFKNKKNSLQIRRKHARNYWGKCLYLLIAQQIFKMVRIISKSRVSLYIHLLPRWGDFSYYLLGYLLVTFIWSLWLFIFVFQKLCGVCSAWFVNRWIDLLCIHK